MENYNQCANCEKRCPKEMYFCLQKSHVICQKCHTKNPYCSKCPKREASTSKDPEMSYLVHMIKFHEENPELCCNHHLAFCDDSTRHRGICCRQFIRCPLQRRLLNTKEFVKCNICVKQHYYKSHFSLLHNVHMELASRREQAEKRSNV